MSQAMSEKAIEALREAQQVLAELTGGDTKQSVVSLFARAVEAEMKARAALATAQRVAGEDDPFTLGKIVGKAIGWDAAKRDSSALLEKLVRKGTDGRWRTTQHGDTDVTNLVEAALALSPSKGSEEL